MDKPRKPGKRASHGEWERYHDAVAFWKSQQPVNKLIEKHMKHIARIIIGSVLTLVGLGLVVLAFTASSVLVGIMGALVLLAGIAVFSGVRARNFLQDIISGL